MGRKTPAREDRADIAIWRGVGWLVVVGAWLFVAIAALTFNAADPPSHTVWPTNDPVRNWGGPVGAFTAYHLLKLFGVGLWALLVVSAGWLWLTFRGNQVSMPLIRLLGVSMLGVALCGLVGLLAPDAGAMPRLSGGVIGAVVSGELAAKLFPTGATLTLIILGLIGLVVAFDRLMLAVPSWLFDRAFPAARRAGGAAGSKAAHATADASTSLIGALGAMLRRKPVLVRVNDLDDPVEVEPNAVTRPERAPKPKRRVNLEPKPIEPEDQAPAEEAEEEEEDVAGAPQVFDNEELREKIAKLPVRFGYESRRSATEDDLRDIQNVTELKGYKFPTLDLLEPPEENFGQRLEELVREQAEALEASLREYRIRGSVVGIETGPVITLYHVRLAPGTRVNALQQVASDIARALKAVNIRIVPNQAGRDTVGVEVPNPTKEKVRLRELMGDPDLFADMKLPMFLGKDASGEPLIADLTKMPHMLIAGTTGSGKSVCMNTIIMGFLYSKKPNELKLVLVDPKMVEMSQFKDIPHLMCPVVTEMAKAAAILEWACRKMEERYELLAEAGCRDISGYNELEWEEIKERFGMETDEEAASIPRRLPYMVFIIDELADLMMTNKEVEGSIIRIAQKARAVGIHLILATQRPQANVVTGLIKSNMPCRVSFKVSSGTDSRIVLDQKGGELLLGMGDMLFLSPDSHKVNRAQGTLVDDREIRRVVRFMRDIATPTFERQLMQIRSDDEERIYESENNSSASLQAAQEDPMFDRAVEIVLETKRGSVSLLQRRLAIGYTRASRLIDLMGIAGIISDHKGSVARDVMITPEQWEAMKQLAEQDAEGAESDLDPDGVQTELFSDEEAKTAANEVAVHANPSDETDEATGDTEQLAAGEESEEEDEEYEEVAEDEDHEEEEDDPEAEYDDEYEEEEDDGEYEEVAEDEEYEGEEEDDPEAEYEDAEEDEEYEEEGEYEYEYEDEEEPEDEPVA